MATLNMNSATFCRYCLSNTNESDKEYFLSDEQDVYQQMVLDTFNIQVCPLKPAEKKICVKCVVGIKAAAELRNMINLSQTKLLEQGKTLANELADLNAPIKKEIETDEGKCEFVEEIPNVDEIDDNDDGNYDITPFSDEETTNENQTANESPLPCKSKDKYMLAYKLFLQWKNRKNYKSLSENVFMAYFKELSNKYKPSSLWCIYSMLNTTVRSKSGIDIKSYSKLIALLKALSNGFSSSPRNKVLTANEIEKFINEAPDYQYLATKVVLIFGINGACRRQELANITLKDVKNHGSKLVINITNTDKASRSFTIRGGCCDIVKKYQSLRSKKAKTDRFFQNYQKGRCTSQPIGINKIGLMPKEIAKYLGLPDAESYTGHIFKRTANLLSAKFLTKKRQDGGLTESCVEYSIQNKAIKSENITQDIHLEPQSKKFFQEPSTSEVYESVYHAFGDEESILSSPDESDPLCQDIC